MKTKVITVLSFDYLEHLVMSLVSISSTHKSNILTYFHASVPILQFGISGYLERTFPFPAGRLVEQTGTSLRSVDSPSST